MHAPTPSNSTAASTGFHVLVVRCGFLICRTTSAVQSSRHSRTAKSMTLALGKSPFSVVPRSKKETLQCQRCARKRRLI